MSRRVLIISVVIVFTLAIGFLVYLGWRSINRKEGAAKTEEVASPIEETASKAARLLVSENPSDYRKSLKTKAVSPDGLQKAFLERESGGLYLKTTDLKTNQTKKIGRVNLEDVDLVWQKPDEIFFTEKPSSSWPTSAWSFNLKEKTFRFLFRNESGLMINWLADDGLILKFSNLGPQNPTLTLISNEQAIILPFITLPQKCASSRNKIYCAIPSQIASDVVLPDDYLKNKFYSQDKIISFQLEPIEIESVFSEQEQKIDAVDLVIKDNDLYFTNRYDDKVYILPLK